MEAYRHNRLTIELHNEEVEAMREVLRLAHDRLRNSSLVQMKGSPLQRQAGLVGPELFRVKDMLEKLGKHLGIELPMDAEPNEIETVFVVGDIPESLRSALAQAFANISKKVQ